jgi:hypothetical protein
VAAFAVYKLSNPSAAGETATLAAPTKLGIPITVLYTGGTGNIVVTVLDSTGATTYTDTLTAAGQYQEYISIETVNLTTGAKVYSWSHRFALGSNPSVTTLAASGGIAAFGVTPPVALPASANQAVVTPTQDTLTLTSMTGTGNTSPAAETNLDTLTDSSGGTASTTLASISDTATKNAVASIAAELALQKALNTVLINDAKSFATENNKIKTDIAALVTLTTALRLALIAEGLIKGSA